MVTCAKCSRQNEDHYKFCLGCGANLEDQRAAAPPAPAPAQASAWPSTCPQCNAPIADGQRFCGNCGFNVGDHVQAHGVPDASSAAPAPAAPAPSAPVAAAVPSSPTPAPAAPAPAAPAPTPAAGAVGMLVMINPDGSPGDTYPLASGENVVGRSSDAEVFSRDEYLSPQHARFIVTPDGVEIHDLDSLNGVFVRITEATELRHGDEIRIGQELLRVQLLTRAATLVQPSPDGTMISGSDPGDAWGRLDRVSAPNEASFTFVLRGEEQVIGRERGDILFRDDGYVSGRHARVFRQDGRVFLEDLQSSNGTFVRIRAPHRAGTGSLILMGQQPFRIQLG